MMCNDNLSACVALQHGFLYECQAAFVLTVEIGKSQEFSLVQYSAEVADNLFGVVCLAKWNH